MQKHTKIYLEKVQDPVCEYCYVKFLAPTPCDDVHHIHARGMGGSKKRDHIENLMGMCTKHHLEFGDKTNHKKMLLEVHERFLKDQKITFNQDWIEAEKLKYD